MRVAKKQIKMTERVIGERYRAGRGIGDRDTYQPWLDVHDLSSLGLSARVPCSKTGRLHHLLSGLETGAFMEFMLMPDVIDVQEQYPLDREDTRAISLEMGVAHPTYPGGKVDVVMTTDLVVHRRTPAGVVRYARSVKPAAELDDARTLLKLEIERRYWVARGVDWMLVTDVDHSRRRHTGIAWMYARLTLEEHDDPTYWSSRVEAFLNVYQSGKARTFADIDTQLRLRGHAAEGETVEIVRHLCATGRLAFDPERVFDIGWALSELPLANPAARLAA
jgi:hypothetical protein